MPSFRITLRTRCRMDLRCPTLIYAGKKKSVMFLDHALSRCFCLVDEDRYKETRLKKLLTLPMI